MNIKKRDFPMFLNRMADMPVNKVKGIVFHHTAGNPMATMAGINNWHIDGRGWAGVGYHFGINAEGTIYEGRPLTKEGVHARRPANGETWAVALFGNFENYAPTPSQVESANRLYWYLKEKRPTAAPSEHKDHGNTLCAGKYFNLDEIIKPLPVENDLFYRVVTGSFQDRDNALNRVQELKNVGFDSFITTFKKD